MGRSGSIGSNRSRSSTKHSPVIVIKTPPKVVVNQPNNSGGGFISNTLSTAGGYVIGSAISNVIIGKDKENTSNTNNTNNTNNQSCNESFKNYQDCMKLHSEFDINQCKTLYEDFQKCFNSFNKAQ